MSTEIKTDMIFSRKEVNMHLSPYNKILTKEPYVPEPEKNISYNDVDINTGLQFIGTDNTKALYVAVKKMYKFYTSKAAEIDSTSEKIDYNSILPIDNVVLYTHIYNTNHIMDPQYTELEAKFEIEFKLHNSGLNFNKKVSIGGSQDFGGCSDKEIKELLALIKKYC